ncbi:hypothetical protein DY926_11040 [Komagataeibacter melaceti]|uniref:Uncharacterized protein n=1 Tax=Komagataeibacter melaceti TaxID=2766577 RepID=A0A371YZ67_9PROT|nr:hypothetical protein [Komagataeibacter melaceti]RFD19526.1 hypothetical protein DY926_11040 [Komagataeibacter melaceti]
MLDVHIAAILEALSNWPEATITGGQLNKLIQGAAPNLDIRAMVGMPTGSGALAAFVLRHLSDDLEQIGYQGKDVLYSIQGREASKLPDGAASQIWRTFVSPSSSKHLVLKQSIPLLLARDAPANGDEAEIEIRKADLDEHDAIRRAFADTLPPVAATALERSGAADADFNKWIATLRRAVPGSVRDWGEFRRQKLAELFRSRIMDIGLSPAIQSAVLGQLTAAERGAYSAYAKATKLPRRASSSAGAKDTFARARRLVHAAVDLMTLDELRTIRLPLGVVLDADRD